MAMNSISVMTPCRACTELGDGMALADARSGRRRAFLGAWNGESPPRRSAMSLGMIGAQIAIVFGADTLRPRYSATSPRLRIHSLRRRQPPARHRR